MTEKRMHSVKKQIVIVTALILVVSLFVTGCAKEAKTDDSDRNVSTVSENNTSDKAEAKKTHKEKNDEEEKSSTPEKEKQKKKKTDKSTVSVKKKAVPDDKTYCTVKIVCSTLSEKRNELPESMKKLVPSSGVVLSETKVVIKKGDSALDVSSRTARENGIHFSYQGTDAYGTGYVDGINNIYEKDYNSVSGWIFMLNGAVPGKGAAAYKVKNGDRIVWAYTCNMGKDL